MKPLTLISLFILLSLNYGKDIPLTFLVEKFLPKINQELQKPISIGGSDTSATITFKDLTQDNIAVVLEESSLVHLTVSNLIANVKATFKKKILGKKMSATAKGEVKISVDLKLKIGTKTENGKTIPTATITDFKTDTDLSLIFGDFKVKLFNKVTEPLKKEIEGKILNKLAQNELQKLIDDNIEELMKNL